VSPDAAKSLAECDFDFNDAPAGYEVEMRRRFDEAEAAA